MSPDKEWYINTLVPDFSKTPTKAKLVIEKFVDSLESFAETVKNILREAWNEENLPNNVETSAENDSSVILYADILNKGILLTGDSGVKALTKAAEYAENHGLQIQEYIKFVQVPHHGSRRNVSTESLDRLIGSASGSEPSIFQKTALVSASPGSKKHPRDRVVNAFMRRGFKVIATKGSIKRHYHGMPERTGWTSASPLEFSYEVDDTDN